MSTVKIAMIHDFVCSWCAIGYQHLMAAADELGMELELAFLPHQLNPDMQTEGMDIREYFKLTHGWSDAKHEQYREDLVATAKDAGVHIDFRYRTRYFNTHLAHRLMAEANAEGVDRNLHEIVLSAYHAHGLNISKPDVLVELAGRAELSEDATTRALDLSNTCFLYNKAVSRRAEFNTPSVPAWIVNDKKLIVGSHSRDFFKALLQNQHNHQLEKRTS